MVPCLGIGHFDRARSQRTCYITSLMIWSCLTVPDLSFFSGGLPKSLLLHWAIAGNITNGIYCVLFQHIERRFSVNIELQLCQEYFGFMFSCVKVPEYQVKSIAVLHFQDSGKLCSAVYYDKTHAHHWKKKKSNLHVLHLNDAYL